MVFGVVQNFPFKNVRPYVELVTKICGMCRKSPVKLNNCESRVQKLEANAYVIY